MRTAQKISFTEDYFGGTGGVKYESLDSPNLANKSIGRKSLRASLMESPKDAIINEVMEDGAPEPGVCESVDANTPIL